ncbi:MAG: EAL domain-containing protein [Castellaniella sp.]|uniref:putative bifunctional diguanylate cyclase/phosphodiesterase n=1 Tax=Castellaniella sp. TaxID=1955812 RepID=UPI003C775E2A
MERRHRQSPEIRRAVREQFIEYLTINTTFNDDGSVNGRIGQFFDVTEKRQKEALIWRKAHFDYLTQLPNRQRFFEALQNGIKRAQQSDQTFALIFLDLDLFKEVNDTFGHEIGDEVLRQVARRLNNCLRESDKVARLGGDEFTALIQDIRRQEDIDLICDKIIRSLSQPYTLAAGRVHISCSIGVALYPDDATDADTLLHYADLAMYQAKHSGRNQYRRFTAPLRDSAQKRLDLLKDLQSALETGQFALQYQPIVDMQSGRVHKTEALVRWHHPERGLISPGEFIPLAEDTGLIVALGDHVFHQAARQLAAWRDTLGTTIDISVNVSPVQFKSDGLRPQAWMDTLRELGLPGSAITLEITERLLMEIDDQTRIRRQTFQEAGLKMALDDFGTGYSSVSYLKSFDIDYIKIDQSFIRHLAPDSEDLALCQAIITMAHHLGMQVIAEGIESQAQHELLRAVGCDYGQGYWYSRPVDPDRCAELLKTMQSGGTLLPTADRPDQCPEFGSTGSSLWKIV